MSSKNSSEKQNINELILEIKKISKNSSDIILKELIAKIEPIEDDQSLDSLSNMATISRKLLQHTGKVKNMESFSKPDEIKTTLDMLQNVIENKKWEEPYLEVNLLLEWAVFRAFASLGAKIPDEYGPILNSEGTSPIFTAGGNRPDLVAEFDDFILVVESTITSGSRQYNTETEPVTRHVADIQLKYPEKKVFTIFVARKIDPYVTEFFLVYHAFHKHPASNKHLLIVPVTLNDFIKIYKKLSKDIKNSNKIQKEFFEQIEGTRLDDQCGSCNVSKLDMTQFNEIISKSIKDYLN